MTISIPQYYQIQKHLHLAATLVVLWLNVFIQEALSCPDVCFCNTPSKIVYCSRRGLHRIPSGIPEDSLQINLNANAFESHTLRRSNLSLYASVEHLYLSECALEVIDVDAFMDLTSVRWLDLSNNHIKKVEDYTFRGLLLQHLFLNGNRHIKLHQNSFKGLSVTGLYLHDCSLVDLSQDLLRPLNSTLKNLWLSGNELGRLDEDLVQIFSGLQHLRLGFNPLHCDCEMIWLKNFYDKHLDVLKGAMAPSCLSPRRLKGRHFDEISSSAEFRCQVPMFTNVEAYFERNEGRLKCGAVGEPSPSLYWIQPSGKTSKFSPSQPADLLTQNDESTRRVEGILEFNWSDAHSVNPPSGMYICVARNQAGNVTLTINLPTMSEHSRIPLREDWNLMTKTLSQFDLVEQPSMTVTVKTESPTSETLEDPASVNRVQSRLLSDSLSMQMPSYTSASEPYIKTGTSSNNYSSIDLRIGTRNKKDKTIDLANSRTKDTNRRLFTITELTSAVVLTHLLTILVGFVVVFLLKKTKYKIPPDLRKCCCYRYISSCEKKRLPAAQQHIEQQTQQYGSSCNSSSYYGTHRSMHTSSTDDVTEYACLNGLRHQRLQSYTNSPMVVR